MTHFRTSAVVLFSVAAVLILASIVADRLGAPSDTTATMMLVLGSLCLGLAGMSAATMRVSTFQAAGHVLTLPLLAAQVTVLGLGLSSATGAARSGIDPAALLAMATAVLIHAVCVAGPLSRAGGYSFGDVVHARFGSRLIAVVVALAGLAFAADMLVLAAVRAVSTLSVALGLGRGASVALVAGLACIIVVPGGMRGVAAASGVALVAACAGWALPSIAVVADSTLREGLAERTTMFLNAVSPGMEGIGWVMAGLGLLTMLDLPAMTRNVRMARRSHALAVLMLIAGGLLAAQTIGTTAFATARLGGLAADRLPARMFGEDGRQQVTFCGSVARSPDDVRKACALATIGSALPADRIAVARPEGGRWLSLVLGLPVALGAVFDLALPMLLIATFALMAHLCARVVVHDILYRLTGRTGTSSGRLALQRMVAVGLIVAATLVPQRLGAGLNGPVDQLVLFMAASVPWPLALLACWHRADWRAALCGLLSAALAGAALWFGYLTGAEGFAAGALSCLVAGGLAALLFPARDAMSRSGADILTGRAPGPLVLDKSA